MIPLCTFSAATTPAALRGLEPSTLIRSVFKDKKLKFKGKKSSPGTCRSLMIAGFIFRISLSVERVDCLSPSAAARSVQECVTKDTTASKSQFFLDS